MGADLFFGQADGADQVVETLEFEGGEVEILADGVGHGLVFRGIGVFVSCDVSVFFPFEAFNGFTGGQFRGFPGAGEVEEFAGVEQRGQATRMWISRIPAS